jgi:adenylate cyclase
MTSESPNTEVARKLPGGAVNNKPNRTVTIRWSIFRNLILLVGVIALAISVSTLVIGNRTAEQLSQHIMGQASDIAASSIEPIFKTVRDSLLLFREFGEEGILQPANPLVMNLMFIPFMTGFPQVSSINTGDAQGNGYLILRSENGWQNRIVKAATVGQTTLWMDWSKSGELLKEYSKDLDYDPRTRPWYILAQRNDKHAEARIVWTPPYQFFTTKDIGITAAVNVRRADSSQYVLAFDMLLTDISQITARIKPSANGLLALLTEDGKVLGVPRQSGVADDVSRLKQLLLKPVDQLGMPQLTAAFQSWQHLRAARRHIFRLDVRGNNWWADIRPLELARGGPRLYVVVMVPEHDFMGNVYKNELFIGVVTLTSIGLALFMAILLARRYGKPLEQLVSESERIQNLDLEPTEPITSNIRELGYLAEAHDRMKNVLGSFAKYVPVDLVRMLLARGEAAQLGGVNKIVTVFFTDIQDFTSIAESMTPQALTQHMAEYFDNMLVILKDEQATIDKFVGDSIVAFWNAPNDVPNHAAHAVKAALRCSARLVQLNAQWEENGLPNLATRFGIGTGPVMVGNVGAESRLNYTVIGDIVNLASRLEGLNRLYGTTILVSEQVREEVGDGVLWRHIDRVAVKGKLQGVDIFEPLGLPSQVGETRRVFARDYENALESYLNGRFSQALDVFLALREDYPGDLSVQNMIESCESYIAAPPKAWDGVRRLEVK